MKRSAIYIFFFWSLMQVSCFYSKELLEPIETLTANRWVLCGIKEESVSMDDFEKGTPFLRFGTDGKVTIFTGCNYIDGTFRLNGSLLNVDFPIASNSCKSYRVSDFLYALKSSNSFKTKVERLVLIRNKTELMSFFPK